MKLYQASAPYLPEQSITQFKDMYVNSRVVSAESVSLFFAKVQDSFSSAVASVGSEQTRYVQEAMSQRRAAVLRAREVKFQFFRHEVVSKPESFEGYYTEYLKAFIPCATAVSQETSHLIETLKMTVATFINEYNDEKVEQIHGHVVYQTALKALPNHKKEIGAYFKAPAGKFKTTTGDVMKSMQDIEVLFSQAETLSLVFTEKAVNNIQREVQSVTDLIDSLVQVNITSGVLTRSVASKQRLIDAIHITAEYVEYYHVLLAGWVFYCKAFNELTTALIKFPTQR